MKGSSVPLAGILSVGGRIQVVQKIHFLPLARDLERVIYTETFSLPIKCTSYDSRDYRAHVSMCVFLCVCVYVCCLVQYLLENKNATKSGHTPILPAMEPEHRYAHL